MWEFMRPMLEMTQSGDYRPALILLWPIGVGV
jgi:hypothetical protein